MLVAVLSIRYRNMERENYPSSWPDSNLIINAHAYFPTFLWHETNVGNPIRVGYGGKKTGFQLLFYFFDF